MTIENDFREDYNKEEYEKIEKENTDLLRQIAIGDHYSINGPLISLCDLPKSKIYRYFANGKLHRIDGPAMSIIDGKNISEYFYLNGIYMKLAIHNGIKTYLKTKDKWFENLTSEQKEIAIWWWL